MACKVCGFEGQFKNIPYISDISYDTQYVDGVRSITDIVVHNDYLYACPECGTVKFIEY